MAEKYLDKIETYLEIGKKRTFAGALEWPGWSRSGRDESSSLQTLLDYGSRYARVLQSTGLGFQVPEDIAAFTIVERLEGTATTDFGAPDIPPTGDLEPVPEPEYQRLQVFLEACWGAFDQAVQNAAGKELSKGPRGGGRDLEGVIRHVLGAEQGYLARLGGKFKKGEPLDIIDELAGTRQAILQTLSQAVQGELPKKGPRGGVFWKPRYFVRRTAWHVLDHTWELEDRIL